MNAEPRVTIVVSPRERFSLSERALASVYEHTTQPFELIYVAGGVPTHMQTSLESEAVSKGFQLLLRPEYLSPNQARNVALPHVETEYIAFLDSDALVAPRWLDHLLQCADETGAWAIGPLYLIHEFEQGVIHMAGGNLWLEESGDKRFLMDEQHLYDTPIAKVKTRLTRRQCDYIEFHCMLVRTDVFARTGPLDENLLNLHEERDFCMTVTDAGGTIYIEPKSVVTYVPPPPIEWWDLPYFMLRWSEDWSLRSVRAFNRKRGITGVKHTSDTSDAYEEGTVVGFASAWRSRVAGTRFANTAEGPIGPADQANLMMAVLASVDRQSLSLSIRNERGELLEDMVDAPVSNVVESLSSLPDRNFLYHLDMRLNRPERENTPMLIRLGGLTKEESDELGHLALLALQTSEDRYECWIAAPAKSLQALTDSAIAERGGDVAPESVGLAGSLLNGNGSDARKEPARIKLLHGQVGRLLSHSELASIDVARLLARPESYVN
jgi:glycosyltransferase involved in cell wall biosynthesis